MKKLALILFAGLFALMCKKEPTIPDPPIVEEKPECEPLQYSSEPSIEWFFTGIAPYYKYIDINPYDPNEILLTYIKEAGLPLQVIRYHLQTKHREVLLDDFPISSAPRWSRKDWIIFSGRSGPQSWDIYKMKSNGDSLTQLTFMGNCHEPEWNLAGDRFTCYLGLTSQTMGLIAEENGVLISFFAGGGHPSWKHDSLIAGNSFDHVFTRNPYTEEVIKVFEKSGDQGFPSLAEWISNEEIIWADVNGIFKTDIRTRETLALKESCNSIIFSSPAYSFISAKVIFIRTIKEVTGTASGTAKTSLVIMNADDGSEEEEIDLEE